MLSRLIPSLFRLNYEHGDTKGRSDIAEELIHFLARSLPRMAPTLSTTNRVVLMSESPKNRK